MIDSCYRNIPPVHLLNPCPDALLFEAAPDARCCQAPTPPSSIPRETSSPRPASTDKYVSENQGKPLPLFSVKLALAMQNLQLLHPHCSLLECVRRVRQLPRHQLCALWRHPGPALQLARQRRQQHIHRVHGQDCRRV